VLKKKMRPALAGKKVLRMFASPTNNNTHTP
jgi:hypothetical protein